MEKMLAKERRVKSDELMEEMLAMVQICFEGEAVLGSDGIQMTLPNGEVFLLKVEDVA